jgi:hypothetical protein
VSGFDTGTDPTLADTDTDGDGFSDGDEVRAGTNPNNAGDFPAVLPILNAAGAALLAFALLLVVACVLGRRKAFA